MRSTAHVRARYFDGPSPPMAKPRPGDRWRDSDSGESWRWQDGRGWAPYVDQRGKIKWTDDELDLLRAWYPIEGAEGVAARLPRRDVGAVESRARALRLRGPRGPRGLQTALHGADLEEAIRLHLVEHWGFARIGQRFGVSEGGASNAVLITLARRAGFKPADRDDKGALSERGVEQLREALRKGWKGVDIVKRLAVSASTVSNERRRYSAYLKKHRKMPLPPLGNGQEYRGRKHPRERLALVETLFLAGHATPHVSAESGVSKTQCGRIRNRLVKKLAKRGESLPGCDRSGKRLTYPDTVLRIPVESVVALERLLMQRVPVRRAAAQLAMGTCSAYRIRDELKSRLASEGKTLPPPLLAGSGKLARSLAAQAAWLPPGRNNIILYRQLLRDAAGDEAEARRLAVRAIAERDGGDAGLAEMLDRMKAGVGVVARIVKRPSSIETTLGGVSSGMLV